jgi:hypothetical protein
MMCSHPEPEGAPRYPRISVIHTRRRVHARMRAQARSSASSSVGRPDSLLAMSGSAPVNLIGARTSVGARPDEPDGHDPP